MKKWVVLIFSGWLFLAGCSNETSKTATEQTTVATSTAPTVSSTSASAKAEQQEPVELAGEYYGEDGHPATVKQINNQEWQIEYLISEEQMTATFVPDWETEGTGYHSQSSMLKADGASDFELEIAALSDEITLTMTDGDPSHAMNFTNQKPKDVNEPILQGDLSTFEGSYTNDRLEQAIAESGFTLYGYQPTDYYQDQTTVFPSLSKNGEEWIYWSGSVHAQYKLNENQLPKKVNGYYEVSFLGANAIAIEGKELVLQLVPSGITGPDGKTSQENRIVSHQSSLRPYQSNWWENYQSDQTETDLDVAGIQAGDFSTLAGTWRNGKNRSIKINVDGTTGNQAKVVPAASTSAESKIPFVNLVPTQPGSGAAIGLYKIGFANPDGDQSDTTRPRIVITQASGIYPAEDYYYRQD